MGLIDEDENLNANFVSEKWVGLLAALSKSYTILESAFVRKMNSEPRDEFKE